MKKLTLIFAIILCAGTAHALTPDQIAQQQLVIQQQAEQQRQAEAAAREVRETERIRQSRPALDSGASDVGTGATESADCPKFTTIDVIGNKIYSNTRIHKITDPYVGRCITRDRMTALQNDLTALYIDHKYTLARVYFDQHRSKLTATECKVVFIIEEGIVNKVEFRDEYPDEEYVEPTGWWQKWRNTTKRWTAIPFATGDIFNLKDFEQALDQINRLQSNNAIMDIRPAADQYAAGHSDIVIANKHNSHRTTFFGIGADNGGNKNVGKNNANISINQDNLLALNDNLYIKYTTDTDFDRGHHYSQSIYSALSIPFGYWTASASLSWSDYKTTVTGLNTSFHTLGDTLTQTYSLDRVLYRSARYRTNLGAALTIKDTENWIRDMKSIVGSRRASNVNVFWNNTIYHSLGTLIVKPSYQRGLDLFGSRADPADIYDTEPHLQYDMLKLYLYSNIKFDVGIPVTWILSADGQYSFQNLYGTDQMSLGGEYTVRGFRESTISGDDGFYVRNDVRVPVWNLTWWDTWAAETLQRASVALFGDYGYAKNANNITPDPYNSNSGAMTGIGAGLHYNGKYINWSLMYAHTLSAPEYLQTRDGVKKEEQSIYWRISANY